MYKSLTIMMAVVLIAVSFSDAFAGAAICIAKGENYTDVEYFLRWDGLSKGYEAERVARQDYKAKYSKTPHCSNTGSLLSGFFVLVKNEKKNSDGIKILTWGFGFGTTQAEAEQQAVKDLSNRNWGWSKKDGYVVETTQQF